MINLLRVLCVVIFQVMKRFAHVVCLPEGQNHVVHIGTMSLGALPNTEGQQGAISVYY